MASRPLSEPPSSPPCTPSHDRSPKRGSYDPTNLRTVHRLRSATRAPSPTTSRSPGWEGSKRALASTTAMASRIQKEVAARLNPEELTRFQNVISQDAIGNELDDEYEDYEDADASDESDQESPTPAIYKGKGPLARGEKVLLSVDRSWTAMESDEAYQVTTAVLAAIAQTLDKEASKGNLRADRWWTVTNKM